MSDWFANTGGGFEDTVSLVKDEAIDTFIEMWEAYEAKMVKPEHILSRNGRWCLPMS